jgi:Carboxypeptidase regulatory-like domain
MKTCSVSLVATALAVLTSTAACSPTRPSIIDPPPPATLTLTGRVVDATMDDQSGVADAIVTATRGSVAKSTSTASDGSFAIGELEAGEYTLSVSREGYIGSWYAVQLESDQSITFYMDREVDGSMPMPERKGRLVIGKQGAVKR